MIRRRLAAALICTLVGALLSAASALAAAPTIGSTSATDIQGVSALLTGKVTPNSLPTTFRFEYGTTECGLGSCVSTPATPLGSGTQEKTARAAIANLTPATTYHYRLLATNSAAPSGVSSTEGTFVTTGGFGFLPGSAGFDVEAIAEGGSPATLSGSHPFALTTRVNFNLAGEFESEPGVPFTDGDLRDLHIEMPPGLIEDPAAVPQCTQVEFNTPRSSPFESSLSGESCPAYTQIGVVTLHSSYAGGSTRTFGIFNLVPPPGAPSQFGFSPYGVPITFTSTIRQAEGEYGLTLSSLNFPRLFDLDGLEMTIWGVPWGVSHNGERGNCLDEAEPGFSWAKCSVGPPASHHPEAYLTLPTSCSAPMSFSVSAESWQQPGTVSEGHVTQNDEGEPLKLTGCASVPFDPQSYAKLLDPRASSPTGFDFDLDAEDEVLTNPARRVPSPTRKAVVLLAEGMTIDPSVAAGLGVCTPASYAAETASSPPGAGCPNASKIGDFTVDSPLYEEEIKGAVFLAEPFENPSGSLLALYLVARAPQRGILVKVAGKLEPDPQTGQLTATFDRLPQLPYTGLEVHFREGQRAPLATPSTCGVFYTHIDLTSWNDPDTTSQIISPFEINSGLGAGGACPAAGPSPFRPQAEAGTLNSNAGSYSPFYLHITRNDAEQEITSYSATLPPGLLGKVAGIPYCPEADIEAAKHETGTEETEHPSCPSASEIGHTVSGYGLGTSLTYAPGRLYLAGPYHGSAFSIVAIDSATVGPFDLGVIVVRSAIDVDPQSAQVSINSAGSDPIPHIIDGIPIHLHDIRVYISRPELTLNPTSCEPSSIISTLTGSSAPFTNPVGSVATATAPFQVSDCSSLGFAPKLKLTLKGGIKRNDYPSLTAVLTPHPGDANIAGAAVTLPPTEFLAQSHLKTLCTRVQFAAAACPAGSIYGHASATTPLLSEPLEGPVYLRSSSNPLPDLVAALHGAGSGIDIDVVGRIDSSHGRIRGTFEGLPDAPVTKFVLSLYGGKRGVLVNAPPAASTICSSPQIATARLIGQSNQTEVLRPPVGASCGAHKKHRTSHGHRRGGKG